ncbi:alpha/beta fold hydrolase [Frankia gtarii]|uniref:alpha/beta fold hydrolase n=1 Tax=Frankia gtarii TaxID=2950102 RepID=UPI0021C1E95B|nr:hypothetical protein [Frankia gtarii]
MAGEDLREDAGEIGRRVALVALDGGWQGSRVDDGGGLCRPTLGPHLLRQGFPWPPIGPDGTSSWDPQVAVATLYRGLEPSRARALAARLRPMAPAAGRYPLGRDERAGLPTVVVCAADDELFAVETERVRVRGALGTDPVEIPGGHLPMLTDPAGLAALLDGFTRRTLP